MIHYIENEFLKVGIKEFGCELTSIISKKDGFEYLWQGNPEIWSGQSPILFPVIGRLLEDKYFLNGREYQMQKHGFARKLCWKLHSKKDDSISFILTENEETLKCYPFSFNLTVTCTLCENRLTVHHEVINTDVKTMYFSLGAHPAFNCAIGDRLVFDNNETLNVFKIDLEKSLLLSETSPLLSDEKEIIITKDIFNEDALILKDFTSESITLFADSVNKKIKFNLGKAPYLGIWAKPGAPYVCIEPWFGVNDSPERKDDLSLKEGINKLLPKENFSFIWSAEFN